MTATLENARTISASIQLTGRKMDFDFDFAHVPKYWYDNDAFKSTHMNALSCLFPEGERMFMDAVRDLKDKVTDPVLLEQITGFIKQEAIHGHEHELYNEHLKQWNYPIDAIMRYEKKEKKWLRKWLPVERRLALTCALEHFTAMLAHQTLTNPAMTKGMHPQFKELWRWHAMEETEHKAVAFDVYQHTVNRYWLRIFIMLEVTVLFCVRTSFLQAIFLWKDGQLFNPKVWWSGIKYYFFTPGLVRNIWKDYCAYFRRDFHPWQQDNRELIENWKAEDLKYKQV